MWERLARWFLTKENNWPVAVFVAGVIIGAIVASVAVYQLSGSLLVPWLIVAGVSCFFLICIVAALLLGAHYGIRARFPAERRREGPRD